MTITTKVRNARVEVQVEVEQAIANLPTHEALRPVH